MGWLEASIMRYTWVVTVIVICLLGFHHASSTPEFKRGGVYLSGDVILGKFKNINIKNKVDKKLIDT